MDFTPFPYPQDIVISSYIRFQNDQVKIAWTLEAEALGPALTRFATETRVVATDAQARTKFRRYWRRFGIGIVMIRQLLLPAIRRQAEQQWRSAGPSARAGGSP